MNASMIFAYPFLKSNTLMLAKSKQSILESRFLNGFLYI